MFEMVFPANHLTGSYKRIKQVQLVNNTNDYRRKLQNYTQTKHDETISDQKMEWVYSTSLRTHNNLAYKPSASLHRTELNITTLQTTTESNIYTLCPGKK